MKEDKSKNIIIIFLTVIIIILLIIIALFLTGKINVNNKNDNLDNKNEVIENNNSNNNFQITTCFRSIDKFLFRFPGSDPDPDPSLLYVCS